MEYCKNIFILFALIICSTLVSAQTYLSFNTNSIDKYIGKNVLIFQDSSQTLTLKDVINQPKLFRPNTNDIINFGLNDYNNWIKLSVVNNSDFDKILLKITYPIINDIRFFVVDKGKLIDSVHISQINPISNRTYKHQFYIFNIPVKPGDSVTCYLELHSNKPILVPLSMGTTESAIQTISNADILSGIYFGIMLVMLLYNLFVYFSVRDKSYLVYVNYIFWVTLTQSTVLGYSQRFLWPDNTWMIQNMVTLTGAISGIATIVFTQAFLHTKTNVPKLNILLSLLVFIDCLAIILLLINKQQISYNIVNINAALGALIIFGVACRLFFHNYKPARFFLIAWTIFLISVCLYVLKDYGIVPYNMLTVNSLQFGSALEAVLLSLALADRINTLKKEKEISQAQALNAAEENERIISDQNVVLESKVHERTTELVASNIELNKTLVELKEAETQLVESEKMASLGQLTAGIAHEINNPINFITGNINPLRRDVDILLSAINTIENVGLSEALSEEKQKQINAYKEDIDFDYLKLEISHLLNGINEGASRTAEIVKGLRVFSRLDEDDLKLADINEGIDSTLIIINNMLDNKIKVIKNYSDIPRVECYPGKLNQVFLNIISNGIYAIKKQHAGAEGGVLTISTLANADMVTIKIEDNGTGMDENTKKKVFEPFFTTKEVGEGTGLGMSIVYNTIKKHNGSILINSEPGTGTEFTIEVPKKHELSISGPA